MVADGALELRLDAALVAQVPQHGMLLRVDATATADPNLSIAFLICFVFFLTPAGANTSQYSFVAKNEISFLKNPFTKCQTNSSVEMNGHKSHEITISFKISSMHQSSEKSETDQRSCNEFDHVQYWQYPFS